MPGSAPVRVAEVAALLICLIASVPAAAQWPEFRGPDGQGHAEGAGFPLMWSESLNVGWKVPVAGIGWSSPVVADGRVWLTTAVSRPGGASLRLLGFDARTGASVVDTEVFRTGLERAPNLKNSLASPTPIAADGRLYVHFGAEGTAAVTTDGTIVWKTRLPYVSQHGGGGSPAAVGDLLIINCDGSDDAYVVAIERATGKLRWRTGRRRPFDQAYSTPLAIRLGAVTQVISIGAYRVAAYDAASGREIWRVSYRDGFSNVPRPVYAHGLLFIATGFNQPTLIAVRPDGTGDVTASHVVWTISRGAPLTPSPIVVGDELYFVSDIGIATCVDARTGTVHWQERLGGNYSASPILADGRLYFQSEEGVTTVLAPGRTFQRIATSRIDGATLASMAVAGRALFLRSERHLYRLQAPPAGAGPAYDLSR